jgi:hypothetical protein
MMSSFLSTSPQPLPASHDGGTDEFPELISATANGGNSHMSPLGAPARPKIAIKFGGGYF